LPFTSALKALRVHGCVSCLSGRKPALRHGNAGPAPEEACARRSTAARERARSTQHRAAQSGTGHKTTEPSRSSPKWHWTQNNRTFQKQPKVALDTEQQNQNMKNQSVEAGRERPHILSAHLTEGSVEQGETPTHTHTHTHTHTTSPIRGKTSNAIQLAAFQRSQTCAGRTSQSKRSPNATDMIHLHETRNKAGICPVAATMAWFCRPT